MSQPMIETVSIISLVGCGRILRSQGTCVARTVKRVHVRMAHFQLGSFLIGFVSHWARFELPSFLMICRIRNGKR